MTPITRLTLKLLGGLALAVASAAGSGADYPSKTVTIVIGFAAGGVVDIVGRLIADKLSASASFGERVIVENRPGAAGTIATALVARAVPDGHTIMVGGAGTHVFPPALFAKLAFDPVKDFAPITQLTAGPLVLVVSPSFPAANFQEFRAQLLAQGDRINYASNGQASWPHVATELFKQATGLMPVHVPYKGGPQAIVAILANEVPFSINHIPVVLPLIKAGKLRALATTGRERSSILPDLPTFDEAGLKGYEASAWYAMFAPAGTPRAVIAKLHAEIANALKSPDLREKLTGQGDEIVGSTPEALAAYLKSELVKWPGVIKAAGITIN